MTSFPWPANPVTVDLVIPWDPAVLFGDPHQEWQRDTVVGAGGRGEYPGLIVGIPSSYVATSEPGSTWYLVADDSRIDAEPINSISFPAVPA
ncbi:hypothetical protein ACIBSV_50005 [Embleya sp. NPDC050154]|uniref:hypothetical protein n=1 Tax=Embleya sp. NPDC050154 TaxID=3363988 RepID=UPI0037A079C7